MSYHVSLKQYNYNFHRMVGGLHTFQTFVYRCTVFTCCLYKSGAKLIILLSHKLHVVKYSAYHRGSRV